MELKQKYRVAHSWTGVEDLTDEQVEAFSHKLEDLLNEYKIFKIDAVLNPYNKGVKLI